MSQWKVRIRINSNNITLNPYSLVIKICKNLCKIFYSNYWFYNWYHSLWNSAKSSVYISVLLIVIYGQGCHIFWIEIWDKLKSLNIQGVPSWQNKTITSRDDFRLIRSKTSIFRVYISTIKTVLSFQKLSYCTQGLASTPKCIFLF